VITPISGRGPHVDENGALRPEVVNSFNQLVARINAIDEALGAFTSTNVTTDRDFDADTATTAELADVVGTLISDLGG